MSNMTVRAERLNNCFSSNSLKWCLKVHPHFPGHFTLEAVNPYDSSQWLVVKTGLYPDVKSFAMANFASVYASELAELFENVSDTLCYRNEYDHSLMTYDRYMDRCFDLHLEYDCSLQEIITNDDEYTQVFISNDTGEVYSNW